MTECPVNVKCSVRIKFKQAACIFFIIYREHGWGQERRLYLAAVGMTCQDPSIKILPDIQIANVRVVAQCNTRIIRIVLKKCRLRIEIHSPIIVKSNKIKSTYKMLFVTQHSYTC